MRGSFQRVLFGLALFARCIGSEAQVTWQHTYGGFGIDQGHSGQQTADGGFIVCGSTGSFGAGGGDVYLLKLDSLGAIQWSNCYGTVAPDLGWSVLTLGTSGYLVCGTTFSMTTGYDGFLALIDTDGVLVWWNAVGTVEWDLAYDVVEMIDGFVVVGQSFSGAGSGDVWVVRTDLSGDSLWTKTYGTDLAEEARCVLVTPTGDIVIVGTATQADSTTQAIILKLTENGEMLWQTSIGGSGDETGFGVTMTGDTAFVIGGGTSSMVSTLGMFTAKVDTAGNEVWQRNSASGTEDWEGHEIISLSDGRLAMAGYSGGIGTGGKDAYLMFTDPDGYWVFGPTFGGLDDEEFWSVDTTSDGGYICVGTTTSYGPGPSAIFVAKTDGDTLNSAVIEIFDPLPVVEHQAVKRFSVFPNPASSGLFVNIVVEDQTARAASMTLELIGMDGRPIYRQASVGGMQGFTCPSAAQGSYLLVLRCLGQTPLRVLLAIEGG